MKIQTRLAALCALTLAGCFSATPPAAFCTSDLNCPDGTHCDTSAKACIAGVVLTVSPASQEIGIGGSATIAATVSGTSTTTVQWSLQEPTGGTLHASGESIVFVSSGVMGTFHVTATADADKSVTATATVTVKPLSITPTSASVNVHHTQQFSANGAGGTWSVQESLGGTITSSGLYTAPAASGTFHVSYSVAQASVTATVTVLDAVAVTVTPATATLFTSASFQFSATVANAGNNTAVTWSVAGNAGSINRTTGLYTAPGVAGSYTVTATSVADNSATGSAKITVVAAPVVTVTPASAAVVEGGKEQFTVSIANPPNGDLSVVWSVQETGGGSIVASGNYTAPATAGTYHVIASCTSAATYTGTATITVGPLQITPATANVQQGKTQQFTTNSPGTWSVQESGGGTIDATGLYTPPAGLSSGTFHIILTAGGATASATVTLVPAIVVAISPTSATLFSGQTQQFGASVMNASNTTVTWSLVESPASVAGTVSASGLYTAGAAGTVHLVAKASADPTSSATAVITVNAAPKVTISPAAPLALIGKTAQLTATVSNPPGGNSAVTWSVMESGGPTVDGNGLVTSGSMAGTFHVIAALTAAPSYSATVQLRVTSGPTAANSTLSLPSAAAHSDGQSALSVTITVRDSTGTALPGALVVLPQVSGVSFTATPGNTAAWKTSVFYGDPAGAVILPQSGFVAVAGSSGSFTFFVSSLIASPTISALLCTSLPCPQNAPTLSGSLDFHLVSWQSATGGLAGADVNGLVSGPDANGASILYLSTNDGVYASTDQGTKWTARNASLEGVPVGPVSVGAGKVLYTAALAQKRTSSQGNGGLFFSGDFGATWTLRPTPKDDTLQAMAADPNTPGRLIAGGYSTLYQSNDQGLNWTPVFLNNNSSRNANFLLYDTVKAGAAYAAGILYSGGTPTPFIAGTTDGINWKDLGAVIAGGTAFPCAHNVSGFTEDSTGAFYLSCPEGALYTSSDAASWTLQSTGASGVLFVGADGNLYASGGNFIRESNDGGKTFGNVQPGLPLNVSGLVVDPSSGAIYVGGHGITQGESSGFGVISSGNFTVSNSGLTSPSPLYGAVMAIDSSGIAVQFLNGKVWRSIDGGANWTLNSTGLPNFQFGTSASIQVDATGAASSNAASTAATYLLNGGRLFRSRGTSSNWSATNLPPAAAGGLGTLAADPVTSGTVYSLSYDNLHLSYSTDYGDNWTTVATPPHNGGNIHLQAVRSQQTKLTVLYFSFSQAQSETISGGLFKSTDSGATWTKLHDETPTTSDYNGYSPSPFDDKTFFFDEQGALSLTINNFTNITQLSVSGQLCGVDPVQQGSIYIFQNFGAGRFNFVRSPNNGQTAVSADAGIGVLTQSQLDLAFFPTAGQILAHARGRGFLRTTTSGQ
jgi:hypothetical protein